MRHAFFDVYAGMDSYLHRLNPKAKVIFFVIFLLTIVLTPAQNKIFLGAYGVIIVLLAYLARVPPAFILRGIIKALPFILVICISVLFRREGQGLFVIYALKALFAVTLTLIIFSTTSFIRLLEALNSFKIPKLFVDLLSFMYRYSFLVEDQLLRTQRAYKSRCVSKINKFQNIRILSNILGALFIRTYERAERIYLAMCARGYTYEKNN